MSLCCSLNSFLSSQKRFCSGSLSSHLLGRKIYSDVAHPSSPGQLSQDPIAPPISPPSALSMSSGIAFVCIQAIDKKTEKDFEQSPKD